MGRIESFFWYDLETFGLNPSYDRIAQFAGIRTDLNLNPIEEPVVLYCRLSADYLPDPEACIVTGITPQIVKQKGFAECEFIEKINNIFSKKGTCVCGFNSIRFDDEFIRNTLYRNFFDPYEREWKNDCSRWDIIDLVRATHDLRPNGINWPAPKDNGNLSFKLTELTKANNIDQTGAHDALVDVYATVAVAKLIKEKQGKLFEHFLKLRNKIEVKNLIDIQGELKPLLHTNPLFTSSKGCSSLILPLTPKTNQDNTIWCFDLAKDPSVLISADAEHVQNALGLFHISVNKSPFLAPINVIKSEEYQRIGIDVGLCMTHFQQIRDNYSKIILNLRNSVGTEYPQLEDPDFALYSKFFTDYDKNLFSVIRNTPPEQRLNLNLKFMDARCDEMLKRHVFRNYPQCLNAEQLQEYKSFAATRLLSPPGNPINDIFFVQRKIEEKLGAVNVSDRDVQTLTQLKEYVCSLKKYIGIKD